MRIHVCVHTYIHIYIYRERESEREREREKERERERQRERERVGLTAGPSFGTLGFSHCRLELHEHSAHILNAYLHAKTPMINANSCCGTSFQKQAEKLQRRSQA